MCKFSTIDRKLKRLPLAMLFLAVAVFGWGLHYKLTLYGNGDRVQASEPAAKLLSERERGTQNVAKAFDDSNPPNAVVIFVSKVFVLLIVPVCLYGFQAFSQEPGAIVSLLDPALYMRPPPGGAFSS